MINEINKAKIPIKIPAFALTFEEISAGFFRIFMRPITPKRIPNRHNTIPNKPKSRKK